MHEEDQFVLNDFATGLIRIRARFLVRRLGGAAEDAQDHEQELKMRLWMSKALFDPERSERDAYVTTVVNVNTKMVRRYRQAKKRNPGAIQSLHPPAADGEAIDVPDHRGTDRDLERSDLRAVLARVLARLP